MTIMLHRNLRRFVAVSAGILLLSVGGKCLALTQESEPDNEPGFLQLTLPDGSLNVISPEIQYRITPGMQKSMREEVQMLPPETNRTRRHMGLDRPDDAMTDGVVETSHQGALP